ncbi:MAG: hypothetical protein QOF13_1776 [Solirubrobacterales bacterium]|jgi:hypothetical protein|nr:hypothetical protein [Solirubrobacterales bacterium]
MNAVEGRPLRAVPAPRGLPGPPVDSVQAPLMRIPSGGEPMLYYSMKHRTQLYLDDAQYRWLREQAGDSGSIAAVVRELIDAERTRRLDPAGDPLLRYLVEDAPARGREGTSVSTLDRDLYGR